MIFSILGRALLPHSPRSLWRTTRRRSPPRPPESTAVTFLLSIFPSLPFPLPLFPSPRHKVAMVGPGHLLVLARPFSGAALASVPPTSSAYPPLSVPLLPSSRDNLRSGQGRGHLLRRCRRLGIGRPRLPPPRPQPRLPPLHRRPLARGA
jgi:hypothetical protein